MRLRIETLGPGIARVIAMAALALCIAAPSSNTGAASFDCAKVLTEIEKTICSDSELSKLDEALNQRYLALSSASARKDELRKEQLRWIAFRNACASRECIGDAYRRRLVTLNESRSAGKVPVQPLCVQVEKALEQDRRPGGPRPLYVESTELGGRSWSYRGVDLDRDGKPDELVQSCGSPSDPSCTLKVILTNGGDYELTEETFKLIRFQAKYLVVVGDSFPTTRVEHRRLYELTANGAELICKAF